MALAQSLSSLGEFVTEFKGLKKQAQRRKVVLDMRTRADDAAEAGDLQAARGKYSDACEPGDGE